MITFYNAQHALHQGKFEMFRGQLVPCYEVPARADYVLQELLKRKLGSVDAPQAFDTTALSSVHAPRYLDFLTHAWEDWVALDPANATRDALPSVWPARMTPPRWPLCLTGSPRLRWPLLRNRPT